MATQADAKMKFYTIELDDDTTHQISEHFLNEMKTLKNMIDDLGDDTEEVIPICNANFTSKHLEMTKLFFETFGPNPEIHHNDFGNIDFDLFIQGHEDVFQLFMEMDGNEKQRLVMTSVYIGYELLHQFIMYVVAETIKNMNVDEIADFFHIEKS
jgi:hypothetical protein